MISRLLSLGCLLLCVAALAAPVRSDKDWAIYPQLAPADWQDLLKAGNLAAGRLIEAQPAPNYTYSGQDLKQLTDGVLAGADGRMWDDKRATGWAYQDSARFTLDLGKSQPLGQVILRLQVISKDNTLPKMIAVSLSDDGEYYAPVRRLSTKVNPEDNPALTFEPLPTDTPGIYAVVLNLGYQARYVRLDFALSGIMVSDELALTPAAGVVQQLPTPPAGKREWLDNVFDRRDQFRKLTAPGNLILGRELRYAPQPNYRLTTNATDPADLTNGQFGERTDEAVWFEAGAVGWQGAARPTIFADLGSVQPIGSVVARFLGGRQQPGLTFPDGLRVLLSTDGKDYYQVSARHKRGLDDRSAEAYDLPEVGVAWVHNFVLPVGLKARYLALQVYHQQQFICTDELAVVKGPGTLPDFTPDPTKRVIIVTEGVAFNAVTGNVPICQNLPLRAKLDMVDARSGDAYGKPCKIVLDLPDTVKFVTEGQTPAEVEHGGRKFKRYLVDWKGEGTEFMLQSTLPAGKTDVLYTYGDSGSGPQNERQLTWESIAIPKARVPRRLHVSLAWIYSEAMVKTWPDYFNAMKWLGFNGVGSFPRYWGENSIGENQAILDEGKRAGLQIVVNESPAGALEEDRNQQETKSQLEGGKFGDVCPSYRGQYYQKEVASFAQHAAWIKPHAIFYDIEAYWNGSMEAPRCSRCQERFKTGNFKDWDAFRAAMGKEIHEDLKNATEKALGAAGDHPQVLYGSYRTEPIEPLNDGIFAFSNLYPNLLQVGMPSLYVAGNPLAVASNIAANRAKLPANDVIPWLSTGCYGEYDPIHTRDLVLETFANGARGVTYYWYGHFDAGHFKYHAEAIDLLAPIEDIFMDGKPLTGLKCSNAQLKVCGMGAGSEQAVLVANYSGVAPGTAVKLTIPVTTRTPVYDLDSGKKIAELIPGKPLDLRLGKRSTQLLYVGSKYAAAVARQ
ncbi:MAG: discoidin domain-containing protein [Armatimonadota bacterium]